MKFRLLENNTNNIYYHITPYKIYKNKLYPNEQGLHLTRTVAGAESVMQDRKINKYNIYSVELPFTPKPLYIDFDLAYWSASEIAACLLLAAGEDIQPETTFNNRIVTADEIHITNLDQKDIKFLYQIYNSNNNYEDFYAIMDFLKTKGYNCIEYPLIESNDKENSLIVNMPLTATLVGEINSTDNWEYADEMIDNYTKYYGASDENYTT